MIKKIFNLLFSTRLTGMLFIVFAIAMAVGTFLDAGQDTSPTPYSRTLIFNALWFELIMLFFIVNFTGNIFSNFLSILLYLNIGFLNFNNRKIFNYLKNI